MRAAALLALAVLSPWAPAADVSAQAGAGAEEHAALQHARTRMDRDVEALRAARPSYPFWAHVFQTPDGTVLYGSAEDGRLLASFPARGDWKAQGSWTDGALASALDGTALDRNVSRRREQVAEALTERVGPVVHNTTRGDFLRPTRTYGAFLDEWAAIYERFGVPAELGLAQAAVESGFSGTIRSSANALGLCQWLKGNWARLDRLTSQPIEIQNQTTQAPYCAAYLQVMATKYGSFIPALSEHHAGIANVGKVLINGEKLGAVDVRDRYFAGSDFARDLRAISTRQFRDVVGTYGNRSFLYSEMVFGNAPTVIRLRESIPQERVYAIRTARALDLPAITRGTGLGEREVKRFNPALFRQVPRGASLYLPEPVAALGEDVSFWHEPIPAAFAEVLDDFVRMDVPVEEWEKPDFEEVLGDYRKRFKATGSEEGRIMDAVLGYVIQELRAGRRVLADYRASAKVQKAFVAGYLKRAERER